MSLANFSKNAQKQKISASKPTRHANFNQSANNLANHEANILPRRLVALHGRYLCAHRLDCGGDVVSTSTKRGGHRLGAGRKPSANPATKLVTIKVTPEQHKTFLDAGGSKWLKLMLLGVSPKP